MEETTIIVPAPDNDDFIIKYNGNDLPISKLKFACVSPVFSQLENFESLTFLEDNGSIPTDAYADFLKAAQGTPTELTDTNVYAFLLLSEKWGVTSLLNATQKFLARNPDIDSMMKQLTDNADSFAQIIAECFDQVVKIESLRNVPLDIIQKAIMNEQCVIHDHQSYYIFLSDMLKQYGSNASFLATKIDLRKLTYDQITAILTNPDIVKSDITDNLIETTLQIISDSDALQEHMKQNDALLQKLLVRINDVEVVAKTAADQAATANSALADMDTQLIDEMERRDEDLEDALRHDLDKAASVANRIEALEESFTKLQADHAEFAQQIDVRIEDLAKHNFFIEEDLDEPGYQFKREPFNGIFAHLEAEHNGRFDFVEITASSNDNPNILPDKIIDFTWNDIWQSKNRPDQYIQFDFKTDQVSITAYSIKTHRYSSGSCHLKSWTLMGSHDEEQWTNLDTQLTDQLNSERAILTIQIPDPNPAAFRYIRLLQNGPNHRDDNILALTNIEFFGVVTPI